MTKNSLDQLSCYILYIFSDNTQYKGICVCQIRWSFLSWRAESGFCCYFTKTFDVVGVRSDCEVWLWTLDSGSYVCDISRTLCWATCWHVPPEENVGSWMFLSRSRHSFTNWYVSLQSWWTQRHITGFKPSDIWLTKRWWNTEMFIWQRWGLTNLQIQFINAKHN